MPSVALLPDSMMRTVTELAALASPKMVRLIRWSELVPKAMGQARSSYASETRQRAVAGLRAVINEPSLKITDEGFGAETARRLHRPNRFGRRSSNISAWVGSSGQFASREDTR